MRFHFGQRRCQEPMGMGRGGGRGEEGHGGYGGREGEGRFGGRGFGPRGGRPRMFEQGDLRYVVLKLLGAKPSHGYEIIKAVEERFGGAYAPSPGIVYPTLTLLEEQGLIAVVETEGPRKLYGLTDEGRAELERSAGDIDRVFARMSEMRQRFGGGAAPEIMRAMDNLKTALRLRLSRGAPEDVSRITAILDAAARDIETL